MQDFQFSDEILPFASEFTLFLTNICDSSNRCINSSQVIHPQKAIAKTTCTSRNTRICFAILVPSFFIHLLEIGSVKHVSWASQKFFTGLWSWKVKKNTSKMHSQTSIFLPTFMLKNIFQFSIILSDWDIVRWQTLVRSKVGELQTNDDHSHVGWMDELFSSGHESEVRVRREISRQDEGTRLPRVKSSSIPRHDCDHRLFVALKLFDVKLVEVLFSFWSKMWK